MNVTDAPAAGRPPPDDDDGRAPHYLHTLTNERVFLARQITALGLLAASVAAAEILPTRIIAIPLALAAACIAGAGLFRWHSIDRERRGA